MIQNMAPGPDIPFHIPYTNGNEPAAVEAAIRAGRFSSSGACHQRCEQLIGQTQRASNVLLTGSCTHALEMAALLLDLRPGDEVILPSFGYPSMGNAFALRGARLMFVDIDPVTMNIDPGCIERAVTNKTKAILIMHYGGVACELEAIQAVAEANGIPLIEDAAHCIGAFYRGRGLGTFGRFGALSFHLTKNVHCTQGGAILTNSKDNMELLQMVREKGTDRHRMLRGEQNSYSWCSLGSSYQLPALSAAFLSTQLADVEAVNAARREKWSFYLQFFRELGLAGQLGLFEPSPAQQHNAHLFFIKCKDEEERYALIQFLRDKGIAAFFHYLPLHASPAGRKYGHFAGKEVHTTRESGRLLRLPLYFNLTTDWQERVCDAVAAFFAGQKQDYFIGHTLSP